jgi:hypothetical protein
MAQNPQPVPIPRATRPMEAPQQTDNADLFFKALAARQEQSQQQLQAQKMLADSVMGMMSLMQKKKEADMENAQGQAMLDLRNRMFAEQQRLQDFLLSATPTETTVGGKPAVVIPGKSGPRVGFAPQAGGGTNKQKDPNAKITVEEATKMNLPMGTTYAEMWATGKTPISEKSAKELQDANSAFTQLDNFERMSDAVEFEDNPYKASATGLLKMAKGKMVPASPEGQYMAQLKNISNMVRELGERGVLTDNDIARVQGALVTFQDTKESRRSKLDLLRDLAEENQFNVSKGLTRENVGGHRDSLKNFLARKAKVGVSKEFAMKRAQELLARGQLTRD